MPEPNEVLLEFLAGLPAAIQELVYSGIVIAAIKSVPEVDEDYTALVQAFLHPESPVSAPMNTVICAAVLDVILTRHRARNRDYDGLVQAMDDTRSPGLMTWARKTELNDRYFEGSARQWEELRKGALHVRSLQAFELRRMRDMPIPRLP